MAGRVMVRDLDEDDVELLHAAAAEAGMSLNRYLRELLHARAQQERNRQLFARVAAQEPDGDPVDTVAEVRAARDEQDRIDGGNGG